MTNMNVIVKGTKIIIEIECNAAAIAAATPSTSGKTKVVASTRGNQSFAVGNQMVTIGLNAYIKG